MALFRLLAHRSSWKHTSVMSKGVRRAFSVEPYIDLKYVFPAKQMINSPVQVKEPQLRKKVASLPRAGFIFKDV